MTEDYLSTQDVAEILGVTKMTVTRLVKRGRFPGTRKIDPAVERSPFQIPRKAVEKFKATQVITPEELEQAIQP